MGGGAGPEQQTETRHTFLFTARTRSAAEKGAWLTLWRPCGEGSWELVPRSPTATHVLQERLVGSSAGWASSGRSWSVVRLAERRATRPSGTRAMSPVLKLFGIPSMRLSRPQEWISSASSHQRLAEPADGFRAAFGTCSRPPVAAACPPRPRRASSLARLEARRDSGGGGDSPAVEPPPQAVTLIRGRSAAMASTAVWARVSRRRSAANPSRRRRRRGWTGAESHRLPSGQPRSMETADSQVRLGRRPAAGSVPARPSTLGHSTTEAGTHDPRDSSPLGRDCRP